MIYEIWLRKCIERYNYLVVNLNLRKYLGGKKRNMKEAWHFGWSVMLLFDDRVKETLYNKKLTNINGPTEDPNGSIWYLTVSNSVGLGESNPGCKCFSLWEGKDVFWLSSHYWTQIVEVKQIVLGKKKKRKKKLDGIWLNASI